MAESKNEMLEIWALNVLDRILKEMKVQKISPYNPDYEGSGKLAESINIDKTVFNAAGGDIEKITFFYEYYALFVETGTMKGQPYSREKLNKPYKEGTKYAKDKKGIRAPKPFLFALLNQRVFSLQKIAERVISENITAAIVSTISSKERNKTDNKSREGFFRKYAKMKGRDFYY